MQQQQQQQQQQQRCESPVTPPMRKQPPATPPRRSSVKTPQESPLMMLQRQRHLIDSAASSINESVEVDSQSQPSFSESLKKFNSCSNSSNYDRSTNVSSFQSPASEAEKYYTATVRNSSTSEKVQHSSQMTTSRSERVVMTSSSKVYQQLQEK